MELPSENVVRALVQRYARLLDRLDEEIGNRPLVLPNSEFFPDTFRGDEKSLRRLVKRMLAHAGMSDIPVRAVLVGEDGEPHEHGSCSHDGGGGCGSGACSVPTPDGDSKARVVEDGEGWRLAIQEAELGHSVVLTANLARSLGYVFLMETRAGEEPIDEPLELTVDLAAVALGFGELLLEGSYIYSKGCGGPRVARVTALGPLELAIATALFVARGEHSARALAKELPATQREAFDEARALIESNPELVRALRAEPARLGEGRFELREAKPWLARVFGKKKTSESELSLDELESMLATSVSKPKQPKPPDPKRDELRALVDEALER